jgi:uroporphyrinogen decarboxylase
MNSRERILAALSGAEADRVPLTEIGIWPETLRRWRGEGLPPGITPHEYLGLDPIEFFSFDASLGLPETTVSEQDGCRVHTDSDGCTYRAAVGHVSAPQFLSSSVGCLEDWRRLRTGLRAGWDRFERFRRDVVFGEPLAESQAARYARARAENLFTVIVPLEPCWYYLRLLGEVRALETIALEPDLAATIMAEYNEFTLAMLKSILAGGCSFDALWVFSDLCYKGGMLFSPQFYREHVLAHQKALFSLARENGMKVIYHCDGNIGRLLPLLLEAGIDCIQPLEARAGNNAARVLAEYPGRLSCIGNIDMDAFGAGRERIREEVVTKVLAAKGSRRYIFHSDHSVPDTVSLQDYTFAVETARGVASY